MMKWMTTTPGVCPSYVVSGRHYLADPNASHSRAHRDFTERRLIRDAFAARSAEATASGSELSLHIPAWRAALSDHVVSSKFTMPTWSSPRANRLDTPNTPTVRFTFFAASLSGCSPAEAGHLFRAAVEVRLHPSKTRQSPMRAFSDEPAARDAARASKADAKPI
jgi:hypothetical protein